MEQLSKIPSEAIEQAIHDLEEVESDERYLVDMGEWHSPRDSDGKCHVCMAGAVMAKRYNLPITAYATPGYGIVLQPFDTSTQMRLCGLDMFRTGRIEEGLRLFGVENMSHGTKYRWTKSYEVDPTTFKRQILKLASDLRQEGM